MTAKEDDAELLTHAEINFDPEVYLEIGYTNFSANDRDYAGRKFVMDALYEIYKDGKITGERLLDVGTGPVCHTVFPASHWFNEIVLCDLAEANLAVLREWKAGRRQYLENVFNYMLQLEGSQESWQACSERLAGKVRCIVRADMCQEDMLLGTEAEGLQFDAVNSIFAHSNAATTRAQHEQVIANYR